VVMQFHNYPASYSSVMQAFDEPLFNPSLTPGCRRGWGNSKFELPYDGSVTINFETSAEKLSLGTPALMTVAEVEFDCSGI